MSALCLSVSVSLFGNVDLSPGCITPFITCVVGNMQNQKIPEEPKTQTEWGRQAHLNVCSVWKEPRSKVLTCDLYFLRFVFDLTRRQSCLFGFKRWYERKSTQQLSGEKHVNDVCPLPGLFTRDFASYSSPKMPWWHCGEARSRLQWSVFVVLHSDGVGSACVGERQRMMLGPR